MDAAFALGRDLEKAGVIAAALLAASAVLGPNVRVRALAAAGPEAGQPVVVAYTLGGGLVIRSGLSQWSALLGRDANVDAVTRRAWTLLSR